MKKRSKTPGIVLRLAIAFGIIAYLLSRKEMDLQRFLQVVRGTLGHWPWLLGAMALFFVATGTGIVRWKLILEAQSIRMPFSRLFSISFIGQFFNAFMMGATGGDIVKAVYAARETRHRKTEAITTVLADRLIGMVVLFLLATVMLVARARFFATHPGTHPFCVVMLLLIALTAAGLPLVFYRNLFERSALFRRIETRFAFGPVLRKSYECFYLCRRRPDLLTKTALLSAASHLATVAACYCLGISLQMPLPFIDYLTLFPLILSVASLPITPGGLGVREAAAVALLGAVGTPAAQALPLSLLSYFASLGWGLLGGLLFLFYSAGAGHAVRDEIRGIEEEIEAPEGPDGCPGPPTGT